MKGLKVYVAGSWMDRTFVQLAQERIRAAGHSITHDWTVGPDVYEDCTPEEATAVAYADWKGVKDADAFVWINDPRCFGAATEFGLAVAWKIPAIVVYPDVRQNVFFALPQDTDDIPPITVVDQLQHAVSLLDSWREQRRV
jgi:nucleoside 2-deoxyribosyltransferase